MMGSTIYSKELTRRIFASGAIGNILEMYDLILISLMATTLSKEFFPSSNIPYANVTNVIYVFLMGLLIKPIGNVVMAMLADQYGRKKMMVVSLICTGIGTISIGILPPYSCIGVCSTVLFIILRVFQNFSSGIEYVNSATYLIESSNKNSRGYYASWSAIGVNGGYLLASTVALLVSKMVSMAYLPEWSWRFVFLFSILGIIFGFWVRKSIPESLIFILDNVSNNNADKHQVLKKSFCYIIQNPVQCLSISAITLLGIFLTYLYYVYIPINLITYRNFTQTEAYGLNVISLIVVVLLIPFFGMISDYIDRATLLKYTCGIVFVLALPFFWLFSNGTYIEIILITILLSIPASCFFSLYPVIITGCFPSKIRCTTASLIYQIVVSVEVSVIHFLITYLVKITHILYIPGYLLILSALFCLLGLSFLNEKANETNLVYDT